MAPSSVTCPHCQTTFRITNAQLKATNGSMRCGSCLQIFNAMDQVEQPKRKKAKKLLVTLNTPLPLRKKKIQQFNLSSNSLWKARRPAAQTHQKTRPSQAEKTGQKKALILP